MNLPWLLWSFLGILAAVMAALSQEDLALISQLPACASKCIPDATKQVGCDIVDIECQCSTPKFTRLMTPCVLANCSAKEAFDLGQINAGLCDLPHNSVESNIRIAVYIGSAVAPLFVALRLIARWASGNKFWWDDWLHLLSLPLSITLTVLSQLLLQRGFGHHLWDIEFEDQSNLLYWFYLSTILWAIAIVIVKYSILCLYLRMFPTDGLRMAVWIYMVFCGIVTVILTFLTIFQCNPINGIWDVDVRKHAKCFNLEVIAYGAATIEIITEVTLFALPIPIIKGLQLSGSKKVQLYIFFGASLIVLVIACIRIPTITKLADLNDITYAVAPLYILGSAELTAVHITATIPALRALYAVIKCSLYSTFQDSKRSDLLPKDSAGDSRFSKTASSKRAAKLARSRLIDDSVLEKTVTGEPDADDPEELKILPKSCAVTLAEEGVGNMASPNPIVSTSSASQNKSASMDIEIISPSPGTLEISHPILASNEEPVAQNFSRRFSTLPPSSSSGPSRSHTLLRHFSNRYSTIEEAGIEVEEESATDNCTRSQPKNNRISLSASPQKSERAHLKYSHEPIEPSEQAHHYYQSPPAHGASDDPPGREMAAHRQQQKQHNRHAVPHDGPSRKTVADGPDHDDVNRGGNSGPDPQTPAGSIASVEEQEAREGVRPHSAI